MTKANNEETSEARLLEGVERETDGDTDGALAAYTAAIFAQTASHRPYLRRGTIYWRQGRYDEAIQDLNNALKRNQDNVQAFGVRASCHLKRGDHEAAVNDLTRALKRSPRSVPLLIKRAEGRLALKDYWSAMDDASRAIAEDASHKTAHYLRGLALEGLEDEAGAEENLRKAAALGSGEAMEVLIKRYGGV